MTRLSFLILLFIFFTNCGNSKAPKLATEQLLASGLQVSKNTESKEPEEKKASLKKSDKLLDSWLSAKPVKKEPEEKKASLKKSDKLFDSWLSEKPVKKEPEVLPKKVKNESSKKPTSKIVSFFNKKQTKKSRQKPEKRKKWKPGKKKIELNADYWAGDGFDNTLFEECGKCEKFCHNPDKKKDPGGVTCGGFTWKDNLEFFMETMNHLWQGCRHKGIYKPIGSKDPFGTMRDFCYFFRKRYWNVYYKHFSKCPYNAMMIIGDTAVNAGVSRAIKILQQSHRIKVDGLWGPQSEKACQKGSFNKKKYLAKRLAFYKKLKNYKPNAIGWGKRMDRLNKRY